MDLYAYERAYILRMLKKFKGNRTETAKYLKISLRGLRIKLHSYRHEGFEVTPTPTPWITADRCKCRKGPKKDGQSYYLEDFRDF